MRYRNTNNEWYNIIICYIFMHFYLLCKFLGLGRKKALWACSRVVRMMYMHFGCVHMLILVGLCAVSVSILHF